MIAEFSYGFPGPDYDTLAKEDTVDKVHLSESSAKKSYADLGGCTGCGFLQGSSSFASKVRGRRVSPAAFFAFSAAKRFRPAGQG